MRGDSDASLTVDIVVNNYNYGEYVVDAVESAFAQSHPAVNVIVVDDGSDDDSRERLEAYRGRADLVFKENGGQASALNAGAARCTGDLVIFLDADDVLETHMAARAASAFAQDAGLVKVQFRMSVIDAAGRPTGAVKPPPHLPLPTGDLREAELKFPFDLVWLPTSANAFRLDALRRVLPIPEQDFRVCADWYIKHLASLLGRVATLDEVGARYRIHGRNNYEPQVQALDLDYTRATIGYAQATARSLTSLGRELGLDPPPTLLSLSDLAGRLVSLRLEPHRHPIRTDRVHGLVADAVRATARRDDAGLPMKLLLFGWFLLTATAPRRAVPRLAEIFLFHERRARFNALIPRLHRLSRGSRSSRA